MASPTAAYEAFFKLDTGTHTHDIDQIAVSPDGQTLVTAGECTIRVWDVKTRRLLRMLLGQVADRSEEKYGSGDVLRFALSPDGRWIVALKSWSQDTLAGSDAGRFTRVEVFELATGNLRAAFRYSGLLFDLEFSADGRYLAIAGNTCEGRVRRATVQVYAARDVVNGGFERAPRRVASLACAQGTRKDELPMAVRFIPHASKKAAPYRLVAAVAKRGARTSSGTLAWCSFSAAQGLRQEHRVATKVGIEPATLAVSHEFAVVGASRSAPEFGQFLCHDHEGEFVSSTPTESPPSAAVFSRSGGQLLMGLTARRGSAMPPAPGDQTVQVDAYDTGRGDFVQKSTYYGHDGDIAALASLEDGTVISTGGDNQALHFWSPRHRVGELQAAIRGVGPTYFAPGIDAEERVLFGSLPARLLPPKHPRRQQSFDLRTLTLRTTCPSDATETDFESDKWSILALDPVQTIPLRFNRGGMDMGAPPDLTLFVGTDDEWVIWSRSGYYATSANGAQRVGYHVNRGVGREALYFPADRFKAFYQPQIIQAIVQHGSEEGARAAGFAIPKIDVARMLPPIVEFTQKGVVAGPDHVSLCFTVQALSPDQPVTRVWILRNERFVWAQLEPSTRPRATYQVKLWMGPGRNVFSIRAETREAKSVPLVHEIVHEAGAAHGAAAVPMEATTTGNLYLLSVGVSDFAVADTPEALGFKRLNHAHHDAIAVYNAFAKSTRSRTIDKRTRLRNAAFDAVEATLLLNEAATKAAILSELGRLCARIQARGQAEGTERDVLMVFLSGHGVRFKGEPDLYFWNHDLRPRAIEETGLSMMELGEMVTSVPAEVVLVIDACHAGLAGGNLMSALEPEELARRIHEVNERGMYILNASRGSEKAREDPTDGQGVFTAALLGALESDRYFVPETPGSKRRAISMLGLVAGLQELVPRYTARAQARAQTPVCRMYGDLMPLTIYRT